MNEGPFTWERVKSTFDLKRESDKAPGREGCEQIAEKLNEINVRVKTDLIERSNWQRSVDWPLFLRLSPDDRSIDSSGERIRPSRAAQQVPSDAEWRARWTGWVLELAEFVLVELEKANKNNPDMRPNYFGFSKGGPVVRFVVKVIPVITGEAPPTASAVAKELERQRQRRRDAPVTQL
jgi:hypothetical protein